MKELNIKLLLIGSLLLSSTTHIYAEDNNSLCNKQQENVAFSCEVAKGKYVSYCASKNLDEDNGYISYRFGTKNNIELELPKNETHPLNINGFVWKATKNSNNEVRVYLSINNRKYTYTVYELGDTNSSGIDVSLNGKENIIKSYECTDFIKFDREIFKYITKANE